MLTPNKTVMPGDAVGESVILVTLPDSGKAGDIRVAKGGAMVVDSVTDEDFMIPLEKRLERISSEPVLLLSRGHNFIQCDKNHPQYPYAVASELSYCGRNNVLQFYGEVIKDYDVEQPLVEVSNQSYNR